MAMGDSITVGVDYQTVTGGGYRDPLNRDLAAAGFAFNFVGTNNGQTTNALTAAGQQMHCGFGGWHVADLDANLDGVAAPIGGGDSNNGGYLLTGGHGTGRGALTPDILLLHIGTNDLLQNTPNLNQALYSLVTHIHALSPNTLILVASVIPINSSGLTTRVNTYNTYIKTQLVPSLAYTSFVDQNTSFLNADGSANATLLGADNVHPNRYGYPILAQNWATALETIAKVKPSTHLLTVQGGTGGGAYAPGSVITLQANAAPAGQQFANWTVASPALNNPFATPVVYTMPSADATITANYAVQGSAIVANGTYEISSSYNGLAISAAATANASAVQQQVYANAATQNWVLTNLGGNVVTLTLAGTNQALEVPAGSASTQGAVLDVAQYTGGANQQWLLTPVAGLLELVNQSSGEVVTISGYSTTAGSPLQQFSAGFVDQWWTFYPVGGQAALYPLTVNQGSGGGMYAAGTTVPVMANAPASGYQFSGWTGATSGLASLSAASTTLMMPAAADGITATYTPLVTKYALTVNGGSGGGSYAPGTIVTVTANAPGTGLQFAGWTGALGALASAGSATTTVTMPASAVSIAATYAAVPAASAGANTTVSVQLVGGGAAALHGNYFDYTAGAPPYSAGHWNSVLNVPNTTAAQNLVVSGTLVDSTGAGSALGFQLRSSGAYYTGAGTGFSSSPIYPGYPGRAAGPGDAFLFAGFAFAGYSDSNPLTLTLLGLNPAHTYTVLAYVTPFMNFGGRQLMSVALTGSATTYLSTDGTASSYERAISTSAGSPGMGNYVEFDQVSGSASQTLTLTNLGALVGLSGFQVVDLGMASSTTPVVPAPVTPTPVVPIPVAPVPVTPAPVTPVPVVPTPATPGSAAAVSSIVSIQLIGGGAAPLHGAFFDYTAGVYSVGHWNPLLATGNTTTPQTLNVASGLTDSTGAASTVGLQLSSSGAYYTGTGNHFPGTPLYPGFQGQTSGSGDSFLFQGFAYAGYSNTAPMTLTVTGLKPANTYKLLVYVTPFEEFGDSQTATVALNGGAAVQVATLGSATTYQRTGLATGLAGNYVQFDSLTGSASQTVTFTNTSRLVGVSGVQVVDFGPR